MKAKHILEAIAALRAADAFLTNLPTGNTLAGQFKLDTIVVLLPTILKFIADCGDLK